MKWSWKLFTAFGIEVRIHATFFLIIPLVFFGRESFAGGLIALLLVLSVFLCVVLHEFGHALTARRFGVRTRDITILPIGGLARLERIPSEPRQELLIAVAGPAVNIAIAALLYPVTVIFPPGPVTVFDAGFITSLALINLWLAIFNFIPAFPMDGGRVLRALLATRLDYVRATRIAVSVGQALAFGMGLFGFMGGNFMLILVAFFVYMGATQEGLIVQYRHSFQGLPTSCAMMTSFNTLKEGDPLDKAVEYLLLGNQIDFPVLRDHQVLGMLTRGVLIDALGKQGPKAEVGSVAIKPVKVLDEDTPLDRAYDTLQEQGVRCLPVIRGAEVVGLINLENLTEFAMVTAAMRGLEAKAAKDRRVA